MADILYTVEEWEAALLCAEDNDFDPVDSEAEGGPLAGWLANQYTHEKVDSESEILGAVISVRVKEFGDSAFSPETFLTILLSYQGETEECFRTLVEEHMEENYGFTGPLPGYPDDSRLESWYLSNCRNDGDTYVLGASRVGFYWFDKNQW